MNDSLARLIGRTPELKALPATTGQVLELMQDPAASAADVLDVIGKDPALTANLLKLANSAYFGVGRQIGTVRDALVLLGNRTVLNLAFATGMGPVLSGPLAAYRLDSRQLWRHSLAVGLAAARLVAAPASERWLREQAFTAGLVHDIGKMLLNGPLKDQIEPLPPEVQATALCAAERDLLGFDHAEAGAALAEAWNFPAGLVSVIARHHAPLDAEGDAAHLARAVAAADLLAARLGESGGSAPADDDLWTAELGRLGLGADAADEAAAGLVDELEAMIVLLGAPRT